MKPLSHKFAFYRDYGEHEKVSQSPPQKWSSRPYNPMSLPAVDAVEKNHCEDGPDVVLQGD
jgi:hypothetical protein